VHPVREDGYGGLQVWHGERDLADRADRLAELVSTVADSLVERRRAGRGPLVRR
jgi:hypothetical protein